jgi:uncharacterized membrane protein
MATGGAAARSMASGLLFLNLIMYVVVAIIAGWAINYSIDESYNSRKFYSCELSARAFRVLMIHRSVRSSAYVQ